MDLYQYEKELDANYDKELAIECKTQWVSKCIRGQHIVMAGNTSYHMDDFLSDVQLNGDYMASMINGYPKAMEDDMTEKFEAFCKEIATELIDNEEPPSDQ